MSAPALMVREASIADHEALCALFDELDAFHVDARPDFFRAFDGPARSREQIARWLDGPGSMVLVAETDESLVGLAVLLTRSPSPFAGAVTRKVVEVDNLVVRRRRVDAASAGDCSMHRSNGHAGRAPRISRWRCMPSTGMPGVSTSASALPIPSTGW